MTKLEHCQYYVVTLYCQCVTLISKRNVHFLQGEGAFKLNDVDEHQGCVRCDGAVVIPAEQYYWEQWPHTPPAKPQEGVTDG